MPAVADGRLFLVFVLLWLACDPSPVLAQTLVLSADRQEYDAAAHVGILRDPTGEMTIAAAAAAAVQGSFRPNAKNRVSLGTVAGAVWLHLNLAIPDGRTENRCLMLELSRENMWLVEFYFPVPDGTWHRVEAGYDLPPGRTGVFSRYPAAHLPHGMSGTVPVFIRLKSHFALGMGVSVRTREAFHRHQVAESYLFGLLYGVPLALSLFNFFIFLSLRDRVYLYYVVFVSTMAAYQAMIHGQVRMLELFDPRLEVTIHGMLIGIALFFAVLFSKSFLLTRRYTPSMDKVLSAYMALAVVRFALGLAGLPIAGNMLSQVMGLLSPVLTITAGSLCWRRGFAPARFYVLAWSALSVCVVWHVLVSMSLLPWVGISSMMMVFGSALEAILLSFALADRIRVIRRQRDAAEKREHRYRTLSMIDGLTGLCNRRFLTQELGQRVTQFAHTPMPISMLFMDIDDFKRYNDSFGHPEGDKVLAALAATVTAQVRGQDTTCRYGGEEFVILMPGAGLSEARRVAERIRCAFHAIDFTPDPGRAVNVGLSIGAAQLKAGESAEDFLRRADQALYRAKENGKNCTVLDGIDPAADDPSGTSRIDRIGR